MNALAALLLDLGWKLTGSDLRVDVRLGETLRHRGVRVHEGHDSVQVPAQTGVLVYSAAIPPENPERAAARQLNIREISYSQMLAELMRLAREFASPARTAKPRPPQWSLRSCANRDEIRRHALAPRFASSAKAVGPGAESFLWSKVASISRSFLDLAPASAAILSVEPDHFDCFADFSETCEAFRQFAARISSSGILVVGGDCSAALGTAARTSARVETFGLSTDADWRASDVRTTTNGSAFSVLYRGACASEFSLPIPGRHNILNALAAIALCHHQGVSYSEIVRALANFRGVRRRFEQMGTWRGVTLVDDYAHHPTEIWATLRTARELFGRRRIWCVFQPHQISRTEALFDEFAQSFVLADEVLLAPIYAAREIGGSRAGSLARELALSITAAGGRARFCADLDRISATLDDEARPGEVVMTMGAGDIDRVHHEFTRRVQRNRAS